MLFFGRPSSSRVLLICSIFISIKQSFGDAQLTKHEENHLGKPPGRRESHNLLASFRLHQLRNALYNQR